MHREASAAAADTSEAATEFITTADTGAAPASVERPSHAELDFVPAGNAPVANSPPSTDRPESDLVPRTLGLPILIGVGLLLEAALFRELVDRRVLPIPGNWLDLRLAAWIVAHAATFGVTIIVAAAAAGLWRGASRRRVWSPGAVAFAVAAPSLALPWMIAHLVLGLARCAERIFRAAPQQRAAQRLPADRLLSEPVPGSSGWTWAAVIEAVAALGVCTALIWPLPWRDHLPAAAFSVVDSVQTSGLWIRWLLAVLGIGHLLAAAGGWYWETYEEGGLVTWLSPVVLLGPLLVFLSTALLTGLGRDIAGPDGMNLTAALRDSSLLWGLLSLYGAYYLLTSWAAMRKYVTTAVLGYALCGPVMLVGWESGRRETHRLDCSRRLTTLATGVRQYAENYQELPPPAVADADGRLLYSWRVLVLPFIGEEQLYREFHLDRPWDSAENRLVLARRPDAFTCDELDWRDTESTLFVVAVDEQSFFPPGGGIRGGELRGAGPVSLLIAEVDMDQRVPWTAPLDPALGTLAWEQLQSSHGGRPLAVAADGTPVDVEPVTLPDGTAQPLDQRFRRPSAFHQVPPNEK